ncbi:uncharacterized protein LOC119102075, partial [Pollicipes pollicipes]|uniref:uncharacterized protein LOC119102075 n=1 Tax=Pollicipes pollicipes TaxID=41117 RepID=UPI0018855482
MTNMEKTKRRGGWVPAGAVFTCRRYLLFAVLPVVVLLYWVNSQYGVGFLPVPPVLRLVQPQQARGQYLVDTPTCRIPNVDPFDASVREFARPPEPILCNREPPPLTYSDIDSVYLLRERQHLYGARPPLTSASCCTRDIDWINDLNSSIPRNTMGRVRRSPRCRPLLGSYTPSADGVEVTCAVNKTMVYRDYYHFVPLRPQLEAASLQRRPQDVAPNVLIFMFDSLSRLQFLRWFPRSRRFLSDRMEAFELGGLNKNGDNTWPNLVQMFTGMEQAEMKRQCAPDPKKDPLDGCPFMWKEFKQAGYRTAMAEDAPGMGSFNYLKLGFLKQPTDYYTRPTSLLLDANIAYNKQLNTKPNLCEGTRYSYFSTFKYALDLGTRLADRPYWGFVCQNVFSHDSFNMPYFLDEPYYKVLESLFSSGALNNTVLVTMGDHGLRWGRERQTFIGGLEERLPFMSLYFPRWLRRRYPAAFDNLRVNQHRLSTFRDVPDHFCTCLRSEKIAASDGRATLAAKAVVRELNVLLRAAPQCAPLRLQRVLTARIAQPLKGDPKKSAPFLRQMTTVQLQT